MDFMGHLAGVDMTDDGKMVADLAYEAAGAWKKRALATEAEITRLRADIAEARESNQLLTEMLRDRPLHSDVAYWQRRAEAASRLSQPISDAEVERACEAFVGSPESWAAWADDDKANMRVHVRAALEAGR
jgi:hypothetical protein